MNQPSIVVERLSSNDLIAHAEVLATLFRSVVNAEGSGLGFVAPLSLDRAREYWLSLGSDLDAGRRLLLVARNGERILGSGQLAFPSGTNAGHRAELQKLFVGPEARGLGVGKRIMLALHDEARAHGRSLVLLGTRCDNASALRLYKGLGYRESGIVPGYMLGPNGERIDSVNLYIDLS